MMVNFFNFLVRSTAKPTYLKKITVSIFQNFLYIKCALSD